MPSTYAEGSVIKKSLKDSGQNDIKQQPGSSITYY